MLTEEQKIQLEKKIYKILKEELTAASNDLLMEKKKNKKKEQSIDAGKNADVINWLKNDQENNASAMRELWPDKCRTKEDEDSARSLFSKKKRGEDSTGKKYSFTPKEFHKLYSIKDKYVNKIR